MIKRIIISLSLALPVLLAGCAGKDAAEKARGRWVFSRGDSSIEVSINGDGTGKIEVSAKDYAGKDRLMLQQEGKLSSEGDDIYITLEDGQKAHFYYKDNQLFSHDGNAFEKTDIE